MNKKIMLLGTIICLLMSGLFFLRETALATGNIISMGENDTNLNQIIADCLGSNSDDWQNYLDDEFMKAQKDFQWNMDNDVEDNWKWDSSVDAIGTDDPSLDPNSAPQLNAEGYMEIYSVQQFISVINKTKKIKIMKNLDFMGYKYNWTQSVSLANYEIDGNGKILYNIGSSKSFIDTMKTSMLKNITFDSVKIVSKADILLGLIGNLSNSGGAKSTLDHVRVQNSMFFSAYPEYNAINSKASYVAPFAESKDVEANYVASVNNIIYAIKAHAGGAFGIIEHTNIKNSYSVDSTVIAGGNHSGGFISCSDGELSVKNSFTNNTVYGNKETGVFIGAIVPNYASNNKTAIFENCFSSGTIEGQNQLGGFIGIINSGDVLNIEFNNCYTTSIVGMRNGGKNLGGFIGAISSHTADYIFRNCYAAGEVGSIDTDISNSRAPSSVGGFVGSFSKDNPNTFINCYYDKQTTAMREWATGDTTGLGITGNAGDSGSRDYISTTDTGFNNIKGIKGVLTSDSKKFGKGLASLPIAPTDSSQPHLTTGFTGFVGDSYNDVLPSNADWIYDGGNSDAGTHNCMYPQLSIFFKSKDAFVRAYSYASVATVHEQVWDTCTHDGILPEKTYDTVRDLTLRFTLTSYVNNSSLKEDVDIKWTKDGAVSSLYGKSKPIIGMLDKIDNTKYNRKYWTADKFSPGIEWMSVSFEVKDKVTGKTAVGSRRLRIIPTSNIQSGTDNLDVTVGSRYNHAKDAYFAYSTDQRMAADKNDVTMGVYPDAYPFSVGDIRNTIQKNLILSGGTIQDFFNLYDDSYQVSGEFLTGVEAGINKAHQDNIINVYVYDVKAFKEIGDTDTCEIIYMLDGKTKDESAILSPSLLKSSNPLIKEKAERWSEKLNGKTDFEIADEGRYLIEYEWIMPDGRYMRDSKMIMVQPSDHKVEINVKNMNGTINDKSMQLNISSYDHNATIPNRTFGEISSNTSEQVKHFDAVDLAFKKVNDTAEIKKIQFDITTNDMSSSIQTQTVTIDNVKVNQPFSVPVKYYYSSYEEDGKYYAKVVETTRDYTLKYDENDGYYYLTMDNEFIDNATGLKRYDLESSVKVTIYVDDSTIENFGTTTIYNNTFDNEIQTYSNNQIQYRIMNNQGKIEKEFSLNSLKDNNFIGFRLPIGEYTIERIDNEEYKLREIIVDGIKQISNIGTFVVKADKDVEIIVNNVKKGKPINPTPIPPVNEEIPPLPDDSKELPVDKKVETGDAVDYILIFTALSLFSLLLIFIFKKKNKNKH